MTALGVAVLAGMLAAYGLEPRGPSYTLAFAGCCAAAGGYAFLAGSWPFGVLESVWALLAIQRYATLAGGRRKRPGGRPAAGDPEARGFARRVSRDERRT